ncbi:GTPase of unknown function [Candidatus Phytoplasma australiense]|uniref:Ribosome biogenesis GTPase A n=1 Tax=Phytoplasma australiense TaxID=59748 RepID=B1VAJ6_PHYAS|nr:GTPase of unknown function [Candidatus Phytoplasma australiense]
MKTFNWFPGHMKKAFDQIKNNLFLVDIVFMILDARIPFSSINFKVLSLIQQRHKPFLFLLNKSSLADNHKTTHFTKYYLKKAISSLSIDVIQQNPKFFLYEQAIKKIQSQKNNFSNKANIKIMIVGMPNVGKSTLINSFASKKVLKTANLAGTTIKNQWIKILSPNIQFLDTPGILSHNVDETKINLSLALTGCFKDSTLALDQIGKHTLNYLQKHYFNSLKKRFNLGIDSRADDLVEFIGEKRKIYTKNQQIDRNKVYQMILKETREGRLGKMNFDLDILPSLDDFFQKQMKLS